MNKDTTKPETAKHSPGPWRYCREDDGGCLCGQVWSIPQDFEVATAHQQTEEGEISVEQMKANARLIVAAPELLEALQVFIEHAKHHSIPVGSGCWEKMTSAIAKATGGTL